MDTAPHRPLYSFLKGEVSDSDSVLDLGCGLGRYKLECREYIGVDIKENEHVDIVADIREWLPRMEYDVVLMLDIIEHMEKHEGVEVLEGVMEIAKKIILLTPIMWDDNNWSVELYNNPYQEHKSLWSADDFTSHRWRKVDNVMDGAKYYLGVWERG